MEFLSKLRERQQAKAADDFAAYAGLLRKAATAPGGTLADADERRLSEVVAALGFSLERVEADAAALRAWHAAKPEADALAGRQRAHEAARQTADAFDAETRRLVEQRGAESDRLRDAERVAGAAAAGAERARDRLAELERDHWRLFGRDDPAVTDRRRHLVQVAFRERETIEGASYPTIPFENLMRDPQSSGNLERFEFVPAPGQRPAELADLVARAKAFAPSEDAIRGAVFYLLPPDRAEAARCRRDRCLTVAEVLEAAAACPSWFALAFTRAPGQSEKEFERLAGEVAAAKAKADKRREAETPVGFEV